MAEIRLQLDDASMARLEAAKQTLETQIGCQLNMNKFLTGRLLVAADLTLDEIAVINRRINQQ